MTGGRLWWGLLSASGPHGINPSFNNSGSLASSLLDPSVCLVGASGGVYSLLVGHMALIPPLNNSGSLASSLLDPSVCLVGPRMYSLLVGHMALIPHCNNLGSLASSLLDPSVCLVGASGGVYSLLAGHMAHLLLTASGPYGVNPSFE